MTKYSFIIPVFNTKQYLERCVKSILQQPYQHYEILLINDGSTDGSGELCDILSRKDKRIKVFHQPNSGVSVARNNGIEHAIGDFILFVDSDDWISINYLNNIEYMISSFSDCDVFCYKNFIASTELKEDKRTKFQTIHKLDIKNYINRSSFYPALWSYVFKRSIILNYNLRLHKGLKYSEDSNFVFKYLAHSTHIAISNERLYYYFLREDSAIHQNFTHEWAEANLTACLDILEYYHNSGIQSDNKKRILSYYVIAYFVILFKMKHNNKEYDKKRAQKVFSSFCTITNKKYHINALSNSNWNQKFFSTTKYICCLLFFIQRLKHKILQ